MTCQRCERREATHVITSSYIRRMVVCDECADYAREIVKLSPMSDLKIRELRIEPTQ